MFEEGSLPEALKELPPAKQKTGLQPRDSVRKHYVFQDNEGGDNDQQIQPGMESQTTNQMGNHGPIINIKVTERKRAAMNSEDAKIEGNDENLNEIEHINEAENSKVVNDSADENEIQKVNQGDIKINHQLDGNYFSSSFLDIADMKEIVMMQQVDIFMFVNPKSGAKLGRKILEYEYQKISFEFNQGIQVVYHIIDLINSEKKIKALREMKNIQKKYNVIKQQNTNFSSPNVNPSGTGVPQINSGNHKRLVMAVAGGDGTMMFMAQDAINEGINLDEISFCVLPYGTGNDLSQILGWGRQPKSEWNMRIKTLAKSILDAQEETFNIWDIEMQVKEDKGDLFQWDTKEKQKKSLGIKKYQRLMCNYFSIGLESRIGLGFDKRRTNSVICNKCCYFCEGLKKMCCISRTKKMQDIIEYVAEYDQEGNERILFAAHNSKAQTDKYLRGNPISLVCTNINSMMGGRVNMWESGRNKDLGIVDQTGHSIPRDSIKLKDQSSHDDDFLEFEIIQSFFHLALGKGNRVAQEKGPFIIKFKAPAEGRELVTYAQVDGEFFKVVNPEKVVIKLSEQFGHLKVLKNVDDE